MFSKLVNIQLDQIDQRFLKTYSVFKLVREVKVPGREFVKELKEKSLKHE